MIGPSMLPHMQKFYAALAEQAPDGAFTGYPTHVFSDSGIPSSYYAPIRRGLLAMDCVRQVRRGARTVPSEWILLRPPTRELLALIPPDDNESAAKLRLRVLVLQDQVRDLDNRIGEVIQQIEELRQAVTKLDNGQSPNAP